mgnify:CR=1 FL=1
MVSSLWLIGITNAVNFLDIEDGLAGGTAAGICPGLFAVAPLQHFIGSHKGMMAKFLNRDPAEAKATGH